MDTGERAGCHGIRQGDSVPSFESKTKNKLSFSPSSDVRQVLRALQCRQCIVGLCCGLESEELLPFHRRLLADINLWSLSSIVEFRTTPCCHSNVHCLPISPTSEPRENSLFSSCDSLPLRPRGSAFFKVGRKMLGKTGPAGPRTRRPRLP